MFLKKKKKATLKFWHKNKHRLGTISSAHLSCPAQNCYATPEHLPLAPGPCSAPLEPINPGSPSPRRVIRAASKPRWERFLLRKHH